MDSLYKRKINKIYKKLDSLSSKGKDNILEYYKYINEIIEKKDYSVFEEVINLYYGIDISKYSNVSEFRDILWNEICLQTKLPLLKKISKLYNDNGIYQQSTYIFKENDYDVDENGKIIPIGQIIEGEKTTDNYKYLVKNKMYARLVGELATFLIVITKDGEYVIGETENINDNYYYSYDFELTPEQNLFNMYSIAVDILLN